MDELINSYKNSGALHHAYVIEGNVELIREALFEFIEKTLQHAVRGNPDFLHLTFEVFGIDEARNLRGLQGNRAFEGGRKIFVIETGSLTIEAQNSLLKVFEEPTAGTHFFLLMPSVHTMLPTLRSRVQILKNTYLAVRPPSNAKTFLAMSQAERAHAIKQLIDDKDKKGAVEFVNDLLLEYRSRIDLLKATPEEIFVLEEIQKVSSYLSDRSSSVKQLLEHISVIIPPSS